MHGCFRSSFVDGGHRSDREETSSWNVRQSSVGGRFGSLSQRSVGEEHSLRRGEEVDFLHRFRIHASQLRPVRRRQSLRGIRRRGQRRFLDLSEPRGTETLVESLLSKSRDRRVNRHG